MDELERVTLVDSLRVKKIKEAIKVFDAVEERQNMTMTADGPAKTFLQEIRIEDVQQIYQCLTAAIAEPSCVLRLPQ